MSPASKWINFKPLKNDKREISNHFNLSKKSNNKLHARFTYDIDPSAKEALKVDYYFFVPSKLHINHEYYSREIFYRHLDCEVTRPAPKVESQPGQRTQDALLDALKKLKGWQNTDTTVDDFKLLACAYQDFVITKVKKLNQREHAQLSRSVLRWCTFIKQFMIEFDDTLDHDFIGPPIASTKVTLDAISPIREYCNLIAESQLFKVLQSKVFDHVSLRNRVLLTLNFLYKDRVQQSYPSIASLKGNNEYFVYRLKGLRRYVEEPLHLTNDQNKIGEMRQQLLYGFAAGVAMVFATGIAFYTQQKYGNFSQSFFVALVISYIFKDRIKELIRMYAQAHLMHKIGDFKTLLIRKGKKSPVGQVIQAMRFTHAGRCNPAVIEVAKRNTQKDVIDAGLKHDILHYKRTIRIKPPFFQEHSRFEVPQSIVDECTFNFEHFLRHIAPGKEKIWAISDQGPKRVKSDRVHHVICVVRIEQEGQVDYQSWNIVLSAQGIKRVVKRDKVKKSARLLWHEDNAKLKYDKRLEEAINAYDATDLRSLNHQLEAEIKDEDATRK